MGCKNDQADPIVASERFPSVSWYLYHPSPLIEAIVDAADHAMSIVIIGVGEANFDNMEILDGDDWFWEVFSNEKLKSRIFFEPKIFREHSPSHEPLKNRRTGKVCSRDIVQFVQLSKFHNLGSNSSRSLEFNKDVLREIPDQVVSYFMRKGVTP